MPTMRTITMSPSQSIEMPVAPHPPRSLPLDVIEEETDSLTHTSDFPNRGVVDRNQYIYIYILYIYIYIYRCIYIYIIYYVLYIL